MVDLQNDLDVLRRTCPTCLKSLGEHENYEAFVCLSDLAAPLSSSLRERLAKIVHDAGKGRLAMAMCEYLADSIMASGEIMESEKSSALDTITTPSGDTLSITMVKGKKPSDDGFESLGIVDF